MENEILLTYEPNYAIPPGDTIQELINDRGVRLSDFCKTLMITPPIAGGLLAGSVRLDREMAVGLEMLFDIPVSFWMNLEKNYNQTILRLWEEQTDESNVQERDNGGDTTGNS